MKKLLSLFVPVLLLLLSHNSIAQLPSYVSSTGLQAWWPFNGDANDASSSANNLTNNGATLTADRFSNTNSAYDFNGSNQYLLLSSPSFSFGQSSQFTISFWSQRASTGYGVTMMHGTGASGNFIWNFQSGSSGAYQFGTNKQGSAWYWAAGTYAPPAWEHFVGTYDNGVMTLYKNGVLVTTTTNSHTAVAQTNLPLYVGRGVNGAYFTGKVDDIGIWDRVLSTTEITALYLGCTSISNQPSDVTSSAGVNQKIGVSANNPSATFQWQMDNGSGYQDLSNGGQYADVTTDTLSILGITLLNDGSNFRCIVEAGTSCADTSLSAVLNVCGDIISQPRDTIVGLNAVAQFTAVSSDAAAIYQWQSDTGNGFASLANGGQYTGTNSSTLTINNVLISNSGQLLRCLVNSSVCSDTSNVARLLIAVVGLNEELDNTHTFDIYPNPATDKITIKLGASNSSKTYVVLNSIGEEIESGKLLGLETTVKLKGYAAGYYILNIEGTKRAFVVKP